MSFLLANDLLIIPCSGNGPVSSSVNTLFFIKQQNETFAQYPDRLAAPEIQQYSNKFRINLAK